MGGVISLLLIVLAFYFGMRRGKAATEGQPALRETVTSPRLSPPPVVQAINSDLTYRHQSNAGRSIAAPSPMAASSVPSSTVANPQPMPVFNKVCATYEALLNAYGAIHSLFLFSFPAIRGAKVTSA